MIFWIEIYELKLQDKDFKLVLAKGTLVPSVHEFETEF